VPKESYRIPLKQENIDFIKNAMAGVVREGTSSRAFLNAGYVSAGKTGTAQVIAIKKNEKYDASKVDERHRDHSLYTAFAPVDKPRIAIAIIVENGGFGSAAAAPIVRKALDYYLLGKRPEDPEKPALPAEAAAVRTGTPAVPKAVSKAVPVVVPVAAPAAPQTKGVRQ
jgi:penicillin-binding protein 2